MILYLLQMLGVAVFACNGACEAGRKHFDLVGVAVVSFVTAMGGGTVRDILLNRDVLLWTADPVYLYVGVGTGLLTWAAAKIWLPSAKLLLILDAGGMALFAISGVQIAEQYGQPASIAIVMGLITGAAGGVFRDILCGEVPLIFQGSELYVTAALIGSLAYLSAKALGTPTATATLLGVSTIFILRIAALKWRWRLPLFKIPNP